MNIKSEESVYLFCQLLNEGSKDEGTSLFVQHLYKSNQLKYLKLLFNKEFVINNNPDISWLIAIESVLEKFAFEFDGFLATIEKNSLKEHFVDVGSISLNLLQLINSFRAHVFTSLSFEKMFEVVGKFVRNANDSLRKLKSANSGIITNIKSADEFLKNLASISLTSNHRGLYFVYKGDNKNGK